MSPQVYIDGRSHHEVNFYKQQAKPAVSNIPAELPAELMDQLLELEESVKKNNSSASSVANSRRSSSSSDTSHWNIKVTSIRKVVKDDDENKSKALALYSIIVVYHRGGRFSCFYTKYIENDFLSRFAQFPNLIITPEPYITQFLRKQN